MTGTRVGVMKRAAGLLGLTFETYMQYKKDGLKHCTKCRTWKSIERFGKDRTRYDKLSAKCFDCCRVMIYINRKGRPSAFKGHHHTTGYGKLLSLRMQGNKYNLGKKHTIETRKKISCIARERSLRGKDCHSYIDGKYEERKRERYGTKYKQWRFDVYARDNFTCQVCEDARGGNLNAHHIKPFARFPELRFDISNGITLCDICHKKAHVT